MKALAKFNSVVIGITTLLMFMIWYGIQILPTQWSNIKVVSYVLSFIMSLGFYRLFFNILSIVFNKIRMFRKWILGASYLEGIWVGCFIGAGGEVRFFYELFTQQMEGLSIRGTSFQKSGELHGTWFAQNPFINPESCELSYVYTTDPYGETFQNQGIAKFIYETKNKSNAIKMRGYTCDIFNNKKILSIEEKVSEKFEYTDKDLFDAAKKLYDKNQSFFVSRDVA